MCMCWNKLNSCSNTQQEDAKVGNLFNRWKLTNAIILLSHRLIIIIGYNNSLSNINFGRQYVHKGFVDMRNRTHKHPLTDVMAYRLLLVILIAYAIISSSRYMIYLSNIILQ